ncbi:methyltetrahydrofolate cobalamin methyltransferase, partial [Blautia wexlerae]|nr:methyltetrahydrofolate cobalamin methyltransferase [Blautia wexlerae]
MFIIREIIYGSIRSLAEAIAKRDAEFIKARANLQADSGASYIDCCASVPEAEEVVSLKWMIDCFQDV